MPTGAVGEPSDHGQYSIILCNCKYNHIAVPNRSSCWNFKAVFSFAAFTANSEHQGGVNVLMADGAVRFISNAISRPIWRALGTRNGHEVVSIP
jgi:prepilin-type processing-associated H-X9-DG protein